MQFETEMEKVTKILADLEARFRVSNPPSNYNMPPGFDSLSSSVQLIAKKEVGITGFQNPNMNRSWYKSLGRAIIKETPGRKKGSLTCHELSALIAVRLEDWR